MLARHPDAAEPDGSAVVEHHGLGECAFRGNVISESGGT
jgi:hypothetical protein